MYAPMQTLLSQPKATNSFQVKQLFHTTMDCLNSLKNLAINTATWDLGILWNNYRFGKREVPTWHEMKTFWQSCCLSADTEPSKPSSSSTHSNSNANSNSSRRYQSNQKPQSNRTQQETSHITPLQIGIEPNEPTASNNKHERHRPINHLPDSIGNGHRECPDQRRCHASITRFY